MRKKLSKLKKRHYSFTGEVAKTNSKSFLLLNVKFSDSGEYATNHIWMPLNKKNRKFHLKEGDIVKFSGIPTLYFKGIHDIQMDYHLTGITNFQVVNQT